MLLDCSKISLIKSVWWRKNISFCNIELLCAVLCLLNCVQPLETSWTVALCPWDSPDKNTGDSFPSESIGKPRNTGVRSLSLLQGILPTQESNWDLLNCRQIISWAKAKWKKYISTHTVLIHINIITDFTLFIHIYIHNHAYGFIPGLGRSSGEGNGYPL